MTKLEELKAALDAANSARAAADAWSDAYDAYEAELKKQGEKKNELELSTNEAHKT